MRYLGRVSVTGLFCALLFTPPVATAADDALIARGRYLSTIAGCNDCHTPQFAQSGGTVPEAQWLTGDSVGYNGPWGTSYPINLRILASQLTVDAWLSLLKNSKARPPMPSYAFQTMTEEDMRALYAFIHWLGAAGQPAPPALAPNVTPTTPYFVFVPVIPAAAK